jgi:hypothetical protein
MRTLAPSGIRRTNGVAELVNIHSNISGSTEMIELRFALKILETEANLWTKKAY